MKHVDVVTIHGKNETIYINKICNTEQFWFGTEKTYGGVPLLKDHLSCKTTFLWLKGWSQMTGFTVFGTRGLALICCLPNSADSVMDRMKSMPNILKMHLKSTG